MRYQARENYKLRSIVGEHMLILTGGSDFAPGTLLMRNETGAFVAAAAADEKPGGAVRRGPGRV